MCSTLCFKPVGPMTGRYRTRRHRFLHSRHLSFFFFSCLFSRAFLYSPHAHSTRGFSGPSHFSIPVPPASKARARAIPDSCGPEDIGPAKRRHVAARDRRLYTLRDSRARGDGTRARARRRRYTCPTCYIPL